MAAVPGRPSLSWDGVCLDCRDAEELAAFYERLLGYTETHRDGPDFIHLTDPRGRMSLNIQAEPWYEPPVWPEASGALTKMMHFEISVDDVDVAVAFALECGATEGPLPEGRDPKKLRVMLDPAGHPFCLCHD